MKLLSNFDTQLCTRQVARAEEAYGEGNVLFIRRDFIYLVFKFYLPLVAIILLWCGVFLAMLSIEWWGFMTLVRASLWWVIGVSLVYFCRISVGKFIDHYMDYMIITPEQITSYDQSGILHRSANSLDASKIKSISIRQRWFLCSLFDYGSIIFFAEGDVTHQSIGQIQLNYIRSPRHVKKHISKILAKGKKSLVSPGLRDPQVVHKQI